MSRADLVVVGGGIAGAAVALEARDRDADVLLLDRSDPGGRATPASAGMLTAQYEGEGDDAYLRFCVAARESHGPFLDRLEALTGRRPERRVDGMLVRNRGEREHERALEAAGWQREAGLRAEVLDVEEARRLEPAATADARSYLWLPDEGWMDTQELDDLLPEALEAAGVALRSAAVVGLRSRSGRLEGLELADGTALPAPAVVLAAGAWSGELAGLPRPLPVRPVRGQVVRYPPGAAAPRRILADPRGRYVVPRGDGSLLAGSTMEDVGFDASATEEGVASVREAAEGLLPGLAGASTAERWAGLRPVTEDRRPVLGPDPELHGLHYATGYGRNGILLAPLAGRRVAEAALGSEAGVPDSFRPDRFDAAAPAG